MRSSLWCGMEAGSGMIYPELCLDGVVHSRLGGNMVEPSQAGSGDPKESELQRYIRTEIPQVGVEVVGDGDAALDSGGRKIRLRRDPGSADRVRCPTGSAVWTPNFAADDHLKALFPSGILHAVSPYFDDPDCESELTSCYRRSLELAVPGSGVSSSEGGIRIASPLLGCGVKDIQPEISAACLLRGMGEFVRDGSEGSHPLITVEVVLQLEDDVAAVEHEVSRAADGGSLTFTAVKL